MIYLIQKTSVIFMILLVEIKHIITHYMFEHGGNPHQIAIGSHMPMVVFLDDGQVMT